MTSPRQLTRSTERLAAGQIQRSFQHQNAIAPTTINHQQASISNKHQHHNKLPSSKPSSTNPKFPKYPKFPKTAFFQTENVPTWFFFCSKSCRKKSASILKTQNKSKLCSKWMRFAATRNTASECVPVLSLLLVLSVLVLLSVKIGKKRSLHALTHAAPPTTCTVQSNHHSPLTTAASTYDLGNHVNQLHLQFPKSRRNKPTLRTNFNHFRNCVPNSSLVP